MSIFRNCKIMPKLVKTNVMRFIILSIVISLCLNIGCKSKSEGEIELISTQKLFKKEIEVEIDSLVEEANHLEYNPTKTLYFSHAFIYEYTNEGEIEEFWLYYNPKNGQLLFVPNDEMIDFVVSDPKGNYYFFGSDGHGKKSVDSDFVEWVASSELYDENLSYPISDHYVKFIPTNNKKYLDEHSTIDGNKIISTEYIWEFAKVKENQFTFITEMIPVNFYQVYGFNKLDGDISLPYSGFDFTGIFGRNQTVTEFVSGDLKIELVSYQFNPYFAEASDYQYSEQLDDGRWKKKTLPLLVSE